MDERSQADSDAEMPLRERVFEVGDKVSLTKRAYEDEYEMSMGHTRLSPTDIFTVEDIEKAEQGTGNLVYLEELPGVSFADDRLEPVTNSDKFKL